MKPVLHVLICSTRPGRGGPAVAHWVAEAAAANGLFDVKLVDLAEFKLPVFDEPEHPRLRKYQHEHTKRWSASVAGADAFVFVTPEYNHAPPSSLVNALDFLVHEWAYKPVGIVSYGGIGGGLRAVQLIKQLVMPLRMMPVLESVPVFNFRNQIGADGRFAPTDGQATAMNPMLAELHKLVGALKPLYAKAA